MKSIATPWASPAMKSINTLIEQAANQTAAALELFKTLRAAGTIDVANMEQFTDTPPMTDDEIDMLIISIYEQATEQVASLWSSSEVTVQ